MNGLLLYQLELFSLCLGDEQTCMFSLRCVFVDSCCSHLQTPVHPFDSNRLSSVIVYTVIQLSRRQRQPSLCLAA